MALTIRLMLVNSPGKIGRINPPFKASVPFVSSKSRNSLEILKVKQSPSFCIKVPICMPSRVSKASPFSLRACLNLLYSSAFKYTKLACLILLRSSRSLS